MPSADAPRKVEANVTDFVQSSFIKAAHHLMITVLFRGSTQLAPQIAAGLQSPRTTAHSDQCHHLPGGEPCKAPCTQSSPGVAAPRRADLTGTSDPGAT